MYITRVTKIRSPDVVYASFGKIKLGKKARLHSVF